MRSIQERLQVAMATAQARARSAAIPSPPPPSSGASSPSQQRTASPSLQRTASPNHHLRSTSASPEFLVPKSPARIVRAVSPTGDVNKKPELSRKSKSRTVIGHPGGSRKVDVPTSASESEGD